MTILIAAVTQEPVFVGWVAVLAVAIFMAVSYLVLVVVGGGDGLAVSSIEEDRVDDESQAPAAVPAVVPAIAVVGGDRGATYADSVATSMRSVAVAVVQRADLRPGERVLDGGTGALVGASAGLLSGRTTLEVDPACGTLAIGRRLARGARVAGADFSALEFAGGWFSAVIAVHTLQFAADPVGVLAEWRRVTGAGGRLSISVPGPRLALAMGTYDPIYERHGAGLHLHLPSRRTLSGWAKAAGWQEPRVFSDPGLIIRLTGPEAFRTWLQTRPWSDPDQALSREQADALERDLLAATPRGRDGILLIPFGALYLTARNP